MMKALHCMLIVEVENQFPSDIGRIHVLDST